MSDGVGLAYDPKVFDALNAFDDCLQKVKEILPVGRERSLAISRIEEACWWAQRSLERER